MDSRAPDQPVTMVDVSPLTNFSLPGQAESQSPTRASSSQAGNLSLSVATLPPIGAASNTETLIYSLIVTHKEDSSIVLMARQIFASAPKGSVVIRFRPSINDETILALADELAAIPDADLNDVARDLKGKWQRAEAEHLRLAENETDDTVKALAESMRLLRTYYFYVETLNLLKGNVPLSRQCVEAIYDGRAPADRPGFRSPQRSSSTDSPAHRGTSTPHSTMTSSTSIRVPEVTSPVTQTRHLTDIGAIGVDVTESVPQLQTACNLDQLGHIILEGNLGATGTSDLQPELYSAFCKTLPVGKTMQVFANDDGFFKNFEKARHEGLIPPEILYGLRSPVARQSVHTNVVTSSEGRSGSSTQSLRVGGSFPSSSSCQPTSRREGPASRLVKPVNAPCGDGEEDVTDQQTSPPPSTAVPLTVQTNLPVDTEEGGKSSEKSDDESNDSSNVVKGGTYCCVRWPWGRKTVQQNYAASNSGPK